MFVTTLFAVKEKTMRELNVPNVNLGNHSQLKKTIWFWYIAEGNNRRLIMTEIDELQHLAEDLFICAYGPSVAYFDIPQKKADPIKVIYCTYAIEGPSKEKLETWMIDCVLKPLAKLGGTYLWWRLHDYFNFEQNDDKDAWQIMTRIAVLNSDLEPIVLDDVVKPQGEPMKEIPE